MRHDRYILNEANVPIVEPNAQRWSRWMRLNMDRTVVGEDEVCLGLVLSTTFAGLNVGERAGRVMVFTTTRITDVSSEVIMLHPTWGSAKEVHRILVRNELAKVLDQDNVLWRTPGQPKAQLRVTKVP